MRVIAKRTLQQFWELHADAKNSLEAWHSQVIKAVWINPQEIKRQFGSVSVLKSGRVVFNIAGNKYRLVLAMDYRRQVCFIRFIGTHAQYNAINAETI
jgi:mRNA interferase HigB